MLRRESSGRAVSYGAGGAAGGRERAQIAAAHNRQSRAVRARALRAALSEFRRSSPVVYRPPPTALRSAASIAVPGLPGTHCHRSLYLPVRQNLVVPLILARILLQLPVNLPHLPSPRKCWWTDRSAGARGP